MLNNLIKLANHLDSRGLQKEADYLDSIISKVAQMEEDGEDFDFFDEEESEESGPLQIDLGPDAVEKVEVGFREPVVEKYSLEAKGFDKKEGHSSKYESGGRPSDEVYAAAESLTMKLADETDHIYIADMRDPNADSFSRSRMIDGKPGLLMQDLVKLRDAYDDVNKYQLVLKTYDDEGRVLYYHKLMTEDELMAEDAEGAMLSPVPGYHDDYRNPRRRKDYNTPFGR